MSHRVVTLALLFAAVPAAARDYEVDLRIEGPEDLYELEAAGDLEPDSVEVLEALLQKPMNINRADRFLLYELPGITYELADAIVAHRAAKGAFDSIEALIEVEGMTAELLAGVAPFVTALADSALPIDASEVLSGTVQSGAVVRKGVGKDGALIDTLAERERGVQSYLKARATGFTYLGGGGLVTYRRRIDARWDVARGALVSDGPANLPDLDNLYLFAGYAGWSLVFGSYTAGFGERVTFDTTSRESPNGWIENDTLRQDNEKGTYSPRAGQFGVAASLSGADLLDGWVDATLFASWTRDDLYQYDLNVGLDEWFEQGLCRTDNDCPGGYTCGADHRCRTTRIYDRDDPRAPTYRYETIRDAYDEQLWGGNVSFNFDERNRVGLTSYYAQTEINLAESAAPRFAWSARLPRRPSFGAVGADLRLGTGPWDVAAEYARTFNQGNAFYARAVFAPVKALELVLSGRYYDPRYDNPHSRARAARDELYGLSARNEAGGRIDVTVRPRSGLRLVTRVDLWGNPYRPVFTEQGRLRFEAVDRVALDLDLSQRVSWSFTAREEVSLLVDYKNKDLSNNSRREDYELGDFSDACDEGEFGGVCGRGERRKLQLRLASSRVPRLRAWVSYSIAWTDVGKYDDRFDREQRVRLHASVTAWPDARLIAHSSFWLHEKELEAPVNPDLPTSDRGEPRADAYLELKQRLGDHWSAWARAGALYYLDTRETRYAWYVLGKLGVEARF